MSAPHPLSAGAELSPYDAPELYDLLFAGYKADVTTYLEKARAVGGPVLEVACGTGRVMLGMQEEGVDIEGIDASPEMVARLHAKAAEMGLHAVADVDDMRSFTRARTFGLIIVPFNAFVHNLTADDQLASLARMHQHLNPGGMLILDVQAPSVSWLTDDDGKPALELELPHPDTGNPVRLWDTRIKDPVRQVQRSLIEIQELDAKGEVATSHRFSTVVRWIHKPEMELLLRLAGFERWSISGDFDDGPYDDDSLQLIATAWRGA